MTQFTALFLAANPAEMQRLSLDREIREITEKIRLSKHRDALKVESAWAVRPQDLVQNLLIYKPTIVHFGGHGNSAGEIILVDGRGKANPVTPDALRSLFAALRDNVRIVLLNGCYSSLQAKAIAEVVECAIGVSSEIPDDVAIDFAATFYSAIGFGRSVKEAFDTGVALLKLEGVDPDDLPQLHVRQGIDTASIVLVQSEAREEIAPQTEPVDTAIGVPQESELQPQMRQDNSGRSTAFADSIAEYRLIKLLQENPRSAVYRAVRVGDRKPCLIKKIKDKAFYRPDLIREIAKLYAETASQLTVALPQSILEDESNYYEVLDFYEGWTLGEVVGRNTTGICGSLFEEWMRDLLRLLIPLHRNGFVHRDISPYNLLLKSDNLQMVLLDFSNALPVHSTLSASPFFTPGFSAPELYDTPCTYASDLYSVGAVLYFLNSCELPPTAEERMYRQRTIELRNVGYHKVKKAILRMLALSPNERFEDAIEASGSMKRTGSTEVYRPEILGEFLLPDRTKLVMGKYRWKRVQESEQVAELPIW